MNLTASHLIFTFIQPLLSLAILPDAFTILPILGYVLSGTVLPTIQPLSIVFAAIGPRIHSMPMLLVLLVLAFVLPSVQPGIHTEAIHIVLLPVAFIFTAVVPGVLAFAVDAVLEPFTCVL